MFWGLKEVKETTGLSLSTLRRLCLQKRIPALKFGNRWFFNESQKRYLEEYAEKVKKFGYRHPPEEVKAGNV